MDIEICIRRTSEEAGAAVALQKSFYRLVAGSPHDNVLLLHETLVLEQFPSPLTFRSTVQKPQGEYPSPHLAVCCLDAVLERLDSVTLFLRGSMDFVKAHSSTQRAQVAPAWS